jgi:hypothetical protein
LKNTVNVFVHTVEDVDYFFKELFDPCNLYNIYTTHAGIAEHAQEAYDHQTIFLPSLLAQEKINNANAYIENLSHEIIVSLDEKYSDVISAAFGIKKINFFTPLHSYHFSFFLSGWFLFKEMLEEINSKGISENIIFDYTNDVFDGAFTLKDFLEQTLEESPPVYWHSADKRQGVCGKDTFSSALKIFKRPFKACQKAVEFMRDYLSCMSYNRTTLLFMERLYDLDFIKSENKFRLIPYDHEALRGKFCLFLDKSPKIDMEHIFEILDKDLCIKQRLSNSLIKSFLTNSHHYMIGLKTLDRLIQNNKINLAVWGNPPISGFRSLFYEYCRASGVQVIGMQHGATYVDQNVQRLFYSDFIRCDHFISYGFTQEDLELNFKNRDLKNLKIYPLGSTKSLKSAAKPHKIDVLFPVTNTMSMLDSAFVRVNPAVLHDEQMKILELLERESKKGLSTCIKPMPTANIQNTSVFIKLQKLEYSQVRWNTSLVTLLSDTSPECVIVEFMSTPLYEVLPLDTDIFLFVHETDNLTVKAREMLEKRVHIVSGFDEFEEIFKKWILKQLPKKRDNSYYNYYVYKQDTHKNILNLLQSL